MKKHFPIPLLVLVVGVWLVACNQGIGDQTSVMTYTDEASGLDVDIRVSFDNLGQTAEIARGSTSVKGRLAVISGSVVRDDSTSNIELQTATFQFHHDEVTLYELETTWRSLDSDKTQSFQITEAIPISVLNEATGFGLSIQYLH